MIGTEAFANKPMTVRRLEFAPESEMFVKTAPQIHSRSAVNIKCPHDLQYKD